VTPSGDLVRRLNHADEGDCDLLRQVYAWAEANRPIYIEGTSYRDAEDFLDPPSGSVEYIVYADGRPVALLTFMPLATARRVYQVGLITNPDASLRKICKLLKGFMVAVFDAMAQALYVDLPDSIRFWKTRKLAKFFGFRQISTTIFLITKSEYGITRPKTNADAERFDQLPGGVHVGAADAGRRSARILAA
jgi:ABC-type amino acid transport substrate-binding protein